MHRFSSVHSNMPLSCISLRGTTVPINSPSIRSRLLASTGPTCQPARSTATVTARLRRKASRMVLSASVNKQSLEKAKQRRDNFGPFASMNRRKANMEITPPPKSRAAQKRSGEPEQPKKGTSPLYKALKMQTALAPLNYNRRNLLKSRIADITSFDQFALSPVVHDSIYSQALPFMGDLRPTPIQRLAIPPLLEDNNTRIVGKGRNKIELDEDDVAPHYEQFLLAAETGSGKTLAYLLPLVDCMKREEEQDKVEGEKLAKAKQRQQEEKRKKNPLDIEPEEPPLSDAARPRAIILVPTSELVFQIGSKVKDLAHTVKFRSGMISSSLTPNRIKKTVFNPGGIDILVATPHLLASLVKTEPYLLSRVTQLVIDEADSLLDRSFMGTTMELVEKAGPSLKKLVMCSATIPRSMDSFLRRRYPDIRRLTSPSLHAIPRHVQMGVVDIEKDPYHGNRSLACASTIWSIGKGGDTDVKGPLVKYMAPHIKNIIVFVNEREEADEVAGFLRTKGIDAVSLSRDSNSRDDKETLSKFTEFRHAPTTDEILEMQREYRLNKAIPILEPPKPRSVVERTLPNTKVLVTTDLASRGIDTISVKIVILYHVPHTTIDFIHRIGRIGRMGKRGRAVVLVGKKDRKDVVKEVREAMYSGQALI